SIFYISMIIFTLILYPYKNASILLVAAFDVALGSLAWSNNTIILHTAWTFFIGFIAILAIIIFYISSHRIYRNLLLELRTAKLERKLAERTRELQSILDNIRQGIFTIENPEKRIGPQYSAFTSQLLGLSHLNNIRLENILTSFYNLSTDQKDQITSTIEFSLGEDIINFQANEACLPKELIIASAQKNKNKIIELDWSPIVDASDTIEKILVCARDVTEVRELRIEAEHNQNELDILQEIIKIPEDRFVRFLHNSSEYILENSSLLKLNLMVTGSEQIIKRMFINLHTLKGTARTYQFRILSSKIHNAENFLSKLINDEEIWDIEHLKSDLQSIQNCLDEYLNIAKNRLRWNLDQQFIKMTRDDLIKLLPILQNLEHEILSPDGKNKLAFLSTQLLEHCYTKANDIISEAFRGIDTIAKDLDKYVPQLVMQPGIYLLLDNWANTLHSARVHIFRNSMDHGFESKTERSKTGKDPIGKIFIRMSDAADGFLKIEFQDDGCGLDLERIEKIAKERGLLTDQKLSYNELAMLIFNSGFTTKDQITEISGRGIGLSAVKTYIEAGGGRVLIALDVPAVDRRHSSFSLQLFLPRQAWVAAPSAEKFDMGHLAAVS
ncbi:MAG: ATP-binding protein, partial [Proteobacteria bacterium]|nr:ATP-binding protein [Pseudomonadota bacterium]